MNGIQGSLNKQFALTVAIAVLISAFNALSLSPALASLLLRPRQKSIGPLAGFLIISTNGLKTLQSVMVNGVVL